jgi:hypothetical protein
MINCPFAELNTSTILIYIALFLAFLVAQRIFDFLAFPVAQRILNFPGSFPPAPGFFHLNITTAVPPAQEFSTLMSLQAHTIQVYTSIFIIILLGQIRLYNFDIL